MVGKILKSALIASMFIVSVVTIPEISVQAKSLHLAVDTGHKLTSTQIQQLRSAKVKLVVPGYVPPGFNPSIDVAKSDAERFFSFYDITYNGPQGQQFVIHATAMTDYGVASADNKIYAIQNPIFGRVLLAEYVSGPYMGQFQTNNAVTLGKCSYIIMSGNHSNTKPVSRAEIVKIVQSLKVIK